MGPAAILYGLSVVVLAGVCLRLRQPAALAWCTYQGVSWSIFNFANLHFSPMAGVDGVSLMDCLGAALAGVLAWEHRRPWLWVLFGSFLAQVLAHAGLMAVNTYGAVTRPIEWVYHAALNLGFVAQQLTILWVALNEPRRRPRYSPRS